MFIVQEGVGWREQSPGEFFIYYDQNGFEANDVTARILELCRTPQTSRSIVLALLNEYAASETELSADINEILQQLTQLGVIKEV